jgi:hypothetical protein
VQYTDDDGLEKSMNIVFTSLNILHPFRLICNGRCDFIYDDLLMLADELRRIKERLDAN